MTRRSVMMVLAAMVGVVFQVDGGALAQTRRGPVLVLPVRANCISSPFGPRVLPNRPLAGSYHYGVDLPAAEGTEVMAAAPGTVLRIQNGGLGGLEILVQHAGFVGVYSHLGAVNPGLVKGATVAARDILGIVGQTGLSYGMHLYFEIIVAGKPVDPAPYLGVPMCNGEPMRPPADSQQAEQNAAPGRRYFQIFPDGRLVQYRQPQAQPPRS
jgi:murein DD-endopeptidase MepM/ murein hydrolase activator NlpD